MDSECHVAMRLESFQGVIGKRVLQLAKFVINSIVPRALQ